MRTARLLLELASRTFPASFLIYSVIESLPVNRPAPILISVIALAQSRFSALANILTDKLGLPLRGALFEKFFPPAR
jgi:hypothetical protein